MTQQVHSGIQLQEALKHIVSGWHSKGKPKPESLGPHTVPKNSQDLPDLLPDLREVIRERSRIDPETGCWIWTRGTSNGYGALTFDRQKQPAHRWSAHAFKGFDLNPKMHVCHTCDNPPCVNPDHLFIGTPQQNADDMVAKGRVARGEKSKNSKLSEQQVREILTSNETSYGLARRFGVTTGTVLHIRSRKTWKHVNV